MEDFFRRHGITPLVTHTQLDAGKRVLQRVCLQHRCMATCEICWCDCLVNCEVHINACRRTRQLHIVVHLSFSVCKINGSVAHGALFRSREHRYLHRTYILCFHTCPNCRPAAHHVHMLQHCCLCRTTTCNAQSASTWAWTSTLSSCALLTKAKQSSMNVRSVGAPLLGYPARGTGLAPRAVMLYFSKRSCSGRLQQLLPVYCPVK